jgi:hypothetical protein
VTLCDGTLVITSPAAKAVVVATAKAAPIMSKRCMGVILRIRLQPANATFERLLCAILPQIFPAQLAQDEKASSLRGGNRRSNPGGASELDCFASSRKITRRNSRVVPGGNSGFR